ncbi:MAG TPA: hypothetical protein VF698_09125, partial [Thermoanaerobaculia bacterium]
MTLLRHRLTLAVLLIATSLPAAARIISYAPYTDRTAIPAMQHRLNRHFVLFESLPQSNFNGGNPAGRGQVVVYDSAGAEEPRVVFTADGSAIELTHLAVREEGSNLSILLRYLTTQNNVRKPLFALSTDGGANWKAIVLPDGPMQNIFNQAIDNGGPFARSRYSQIQAGTATYPFIVGIDLVGVYAIGFDGSLRLIARPELDVNGPILGMDRTGSRIAVRTTRTRFQIFDLDRQERGSGALEAHLNYTGFITPDDAVYLESSDRRLQYFRNGVATQLAEGKPGYTDVLLSPPVFVYPPMFAIPTADFTGAWILEREFEKPTILSKHTFATGKVTQWADMNRPDVEALHAGASGNKLLIQVHRPRAMADQRMFLDPALAVWTVGTPAPTRYDELFMNEAPTKGFVHVDVDKLEAGEPFVFDSGTTFSMPSDVIVSPPPPSAGGADVIQEWGVVRASLRQQLVLPGVGRTPGAFGSNWSSDVVIQNPLDEPQKVTLRYVLNGTPSSIAQTVPYVTTLTLAPRELRAIPDALNTLFHLDSGNGALFLTPEQGVNASSRTYTRSSKGTYGFNMNAIDIYTAASPRLPVSFSGAFPGANFRTNLVLTDATAAGSQVALQGFGFTGSMGASGVALDAPPSGQIQANDIGSVLRLDSRDTGGLIVRPTRGFVIPSIYAIDNKSNDPTYFPPDLPAPIVRTIPVIGHIEGANNSNFRSDLYLINPSSTTRSVTLQVQSWDGGPQQQTTFTMLPNEARVIPDALWTLFNKTGLARLRYLSSGDTNGVRLTSRTYTTDADGATFGFLMPPLNNFQHAGPGDTLEILGTSPDPDNKFRTNLGIIDTAAFATGGSVLADVQIVASGGRVLDHFNVEIPTAGGRQINDLFNTRNI